LGTLSKCTIILLHAAHDCPGGKTAAIARYVSFAQITCLCIILRLPADST